MNNDDFIPALEKLLFAEEGVRAYAILDGASMPNLLGSLATHEPEYECLYRGELQPDMAEVAPYLVWLNPDTDFPWWLASKGWGKHWGIIAQSRADLRTLRRHFRTFLIVYDSTGKPIVVYLFNDLLVVCGDKNDRAINHRRGMFVCHPP